MNVSVLGFYGKSNVGDEAYKIAFPKIFPGMNFTFSDVLPANCDRVFLGGGDVLQKYFLDQLGKVNAPKYAMSVNLRYSEYNNIYEKIFRQCFVRNLCPSGSRLLSVPDFTFVLESNPDNGRKIIRDLFAKCDLYEKVVVIVLNSYLCPGEDTPARDHVTFDKVCYDLAKLIDNTNASFLLLPFSNGFPYNDRLASSYLYTKCKFWKKVSLVYNELSVQDTLDVIAAANMTIASRLHASIFSCIGGTPFIDLTHHDKTAFFLESINKDWGVNYWSFNPEKLKSLAESHLAGEKRIRQDLLKISERNRLLLLDLRNKLVF